MSDEIPVQEVPPAPDSPPETVTRPEPQAPKPPESPAQQTHPWTKRSFGFQAYGRWLEGTAYHRDHHLDASGWYGELFYESLEELMNGAKFAADEQKTVLETIQRLVR